MSKTISTVQLSEYVLTSSGNPLSITTSGGVETNGGAAIYGAATQAWTITNAGIVSGGSPTGSMGIDLRAGGTIGNTGLIRASRYGVRIRGAAGTVTNTGAITSATDGVVLLAGGSVSNAAGGVITGTLNVGVYITGGAGTVTNAGTIGGAPDAVQFVGTFADLVIVDPGAVFIGKVVGGSGTNTLELAEGSGATGTLSGFGTEFTNFSTITIDAGASWVFDSAETIGSGVSLRDSGTLTNDGTVLTQVYVAANTATFGNYGIVSASGQDAVLSFGLVVNHAGGTIEGGSFGVLTGAGSVSNAGVIYGSQLGVFLNRGGSVTNAAGGSIGAAGYFGVYVGIDAGTVTNAGSITGHIGGVDLKAGGSVSNAAGGVITGTINVGVYISDGAGTVTNAGTIGGASDAVQFVGTFADLVIVDPGAVFIGKVVGGSGTNTLELAEGNGATGTLSGFGTEFTNFSTITIDAGASWVFDSAETIGSGVSLRDSGTLTNDGTVLTQVYVVANTATFGNYGIVSASGQDAVLSFGLVVNHAGGTIEGGSFGVLTGAGSVSNAGVIYGSQLGVFLNRGGSVTNAAGGSIGAAGYFGVYVGIDVGTVTNAGSITGHIGGVDLKAGGSVSNAAGGVITGTINVGVYISAGAGTVTNAGTIGGASDAVQFVGTFADRVIVDPGAVFIGKVDGGNTIGAAAISTLELASAVSVGTLTGLGSKYVNFAQTTVDAGASWLLSGGNTIVTGATLTDSGTLTNAGTLLDNGKLTGGGTLVNDGSISVAVAGGLFLSGGAATNALHGIIHGAFNGLGMGGGGAVVNAGTIIGAGLQGYGVYVSTGSLTNQQGGAIEGNYTGVVVEGGTVTNDGLIEGTGAVAVGVELADGGVAINQVNGTITGPNFSAIGVYNALGTVINAGVISGAKGVFFDAGGAVTNSIGGMITGANFGVQGMNAASTVINAGTISATNAGADAVYQQAGFANLVVVDPGAVFGGKVDGGNTIGATMLSTLELASGASVGTLTGLGSKYIDFAQTTIDAGASWVFSGTNTLVTGATLTDSGTLTNAGTLLDNGKLKGGGTLVNDGSISVALAGGVFLSGGAVTNALHGIIYGAYDGLGMAGGGAVVNAGTIIGSGSSGYGVYLGGGSLTNQQGGTIGGGYNGVVTEGGTVTNDGLIKGTGGNADGVDAADGGLVVNQVNGTITGPNFNAVAIYNASGTVINAGVISGAQGVFLYHGGMVTNSFGGMITGANFGVQGMNAASTVINAGTISATNAGADAVSLEAGTTNRVVIDPGAVFSGKVDGGNPIGGGAVSTLELASAASIGTLTGLGSKYVDFDRVTLDAGAAWVFTGSNTVTAGSTLTNSGTLTTTGTLTNAGVLLDNGKLTGGGTLINDSRLSVALAGGVSLSGGAVTNALHGTIYGAYGLAMTGGGSVVNAGTIIGSGSNGYGVNLGGASLTNQQGGTIEGDYNAVFISGGTVTNDGLIKGTGPRGDGVQEVGGGVIVNEVNGTIAGPNFIGVAVYNAAGTLTNAGVVSGFVGVYLYAGGAVTNSFGGMITGYSFGVRGINAASTVINAGTISATKAGADAVYQQAGVANLLVIDPGAVFSGQVDGGNTIGAAAVSTLELASAASIGTLTGLGSKYINFAQITVDSGASWLLSGGNTIVSGATLTNTGTLTNAGTLLDDGKLTGGGTLINDASISVAVAGGVSLSGGAVTNALHGTIYGAYGLAMTGGGSVVNAGTIIGSGSNGYGVNLGGASLTNQQGGTIEGDYNAVFISGGTVTNDGLIKGTGPRGDGIQEVGGGVIVNEVNGTIAGPNFIGVAVYNAAGTLTNAGVVSGFVGVYLYAGGTVTNSFGGMITGYSFGVRGINAASTVINAGTISATKAGADAVYQQAGVANLVVIDPGAVFGGRVDGGNYLGGVAISTLELTSGASIGTLTGLGSRYIDFGRIMVDAGASWVFSGDNTVGLGDTLTLDSASVTDNGTLVDNGSIQLDPSTLTVGALTGVGVVTIDAGGELTVQGTVSSGQTIEFAGASGVFALNAPREAAATSAGFVSGDTIALAGVTDVTSTNLVNGNTLQVSLSTGAPIDLLLSGNYAGEFFHHTPDGGNTDITVNTTPCFCRGTLIRTDRGDVPVEALAIGDRVTTACGDARPIRWIGRRGFDLARHPAPDRVRPIRILADAFADGAPRRDLFVSPDHAVLRDGVLVPARLLLNGASVQRDTNCRSVAYYHIELDAHDILLAENLPAESYLDTGNRNMFENAGGVVALHPDFTNDQALRATASCAPFADDAARVEPIWLALVARAVQRGWDLPPALETTDDPSLRLLVDRRHVAPVCVADGRHVFIVPRADAALRLVSRAAVPSETRPWIADDRTLGVLLRGMRVRTGAMVEPIPLDHPDLTEGWWQPEWHGPAALRRWTNGDALVPMPHAALAAPGPCLLEVEIAGTMRYRLPASMTHRRYPQFMACPQVGSRTG